MQKMHGIKTLFTGLFLTFQTEKNNFAVVGLANFIYFFIVVIEIFLRLIKVFFYGALKLSTLLYLNRLSQINIF